MQLLRRIGEIVGRACQYGDMVWLALLVQGLLWLRSHLQGFSLWVIFVGFVAIGLVSLTLVFLVTA